MRTVTTRKAETSIVLPKLQLVHLELTLIGDSPLISHAWDEKATRAILDKQMKKATQAKGAKSPERCRA